MKTKRDICVTAFRVGALLLFAGATGGAVAGEAATRDMDTPVQTAQYRPSHAETAKTVKDLDIDAVAAIYVEKNKLADRLGTVTIAKR